LKNLKKNGNRVKLEQEWQDTSDYGGWESETGSSLLCSLYMLKTSQNKKLKENPALM
jgi:hypothetical protein